MTYKVLQDRRIWVEGAYRILKQNEIIGDALLPKNAYADLVKYGYLEVTTEKEKPVAAEKPTRNKPGTKSLKPATENKAINPVAEDK